MWSPIKGLPIGDIAIEMCGGEAGMNEDEMAICGRDMAIGDQGEPRGECDGRNEAGDMPCGKDPPSAKN